MSGGYFNYGFAAVEEYVGKMEDIELDSLIADVGKLLHDLEWYKSGDTSEDDYRESVNAFKRKWLEGKPDARMMEIFRKRIRELGNGITAMLDWYTHDMEDIIKPEE